MMAMIIDGHNLIPKLDGLSLSNPDDELHLIRLLQDYSRLRRRKVEVYFDGAPAGEAGERRFGQVSAHFVRLGMTADDAIMTRLRQLGKRAKNFTVVSSDHQVQQAARALHASVMSSEEFVKDWRKLVETEPEIDPHNRPLSESEVEEWERIFRKGRLE